MKRSYLLLVTLFLFSYSYSQRILTTEEDKFYDYLEKGIELTVYNAKSNGNYKPSLESKIFLIYFDDDSNLRCVEHTHNNMLIGRLLDFGWTPYERYTDINFTWIYTQFIITNNKRQPTNTDYSAEVKLRILNNPEKKFNLKIDYKLGSKKGIIEEYSGKHKLVDWSEY